MKIYCYTINLEKKIKKMKLSETIKYFNQRINLKEIEDFFLTQDKTNSKYLVIEDICLNFSLKELKLKIDRMKLSKIVILTLNNENLNKYQNQNIQILNIQSQDFQMKIKQFFNPEQQAKKQFNQSSLNFETTNFENIILAFSLDHKLYATTLLLNFANIVQKEKLEEVIYIEKKQSKIEYHKLLDLQQFNIKYYQIKNLEHLEKLGEDLTLKNNNKIKILDYGTINTYTELKTILNFKFKAKICFTTNCLKVEENSDYLKMLRYIQKNNVKIINRSTIFYAKIQNTINPLNHKQFEKKIKKEMKCLI